MHEVRVQRDAEPGAADGDGQVGGAARQQRRCARRARSSSSEAAGAGGQQRDRRHGPRLGTAGTSAGAISAISARARARRRTGRPGATSSGATLRVRRSDGSAVSASRHAPTGIDRPPASAITPFGPTRKPGVASACRANSAVMVENAVAISTVRPSRARAPAMLTARPTRGWSARPRRRRARNGAWRTSPPGARRTRRRASDAAAAEQPTASEPVRDISQDESGLPPGHCQRDQSLRSPADSEAPSPAARRCERSSSPRVARGVSRRARGRAR